MTLVERLQHFEGRLYRSSELIEVAAFANDYLRVPEMDGRVSMRYKKSWRARALIQLCRQTQTSGGLAWGWDWHGEQKYRIEQLPLPPEKRKPSTLPADCIHGNGHTLEFKYFPPRSKNTGYPLKTVVREYLLTNKLPHAVMRILAEKIRERDRNVWVAYSTRKELGRLMGNKLPIAAE